MRRRRTRRRRKRKESSSYTMENGEDVQCGGAELEDEKAPSVGPDASNEDEAPATPEKSSPALDGSCPVTPERSSAASASSTGQGSNSSADDDYGCEHYKRKSKFVTPCCNKVYTCRFCHDEQETHTVNRKEITELICVLCDTRQPVQATCQNCHCRFGKYTCLECNLFDDEDKNQYHCNGCGICRVGGRNRFFHCAKCNMCLPILLQNGHTCVENVSHANCPVCLEDIHTSRIPCHIPDCGHLLHRTCFEELLHSGHYACPTCQVSLLDMTDLWQFLDMEVTLTPMPEEYRDYKADILCKDCHEESTVKFHVVGLKCLNCGSYNTCRVKGSPSPDPDTLDEAAGGSSTDDKEQSQGQSPEY